MVDRTPQPLNGLARDFSKRETHFQVQLHLLLLSFLSNKMLTVKHVIPILLTLRREVMHCVATSKKCTKLPDAKANVFASIWVRFRIFVQS